MHFYNSLLLISNFFILKVQTQTQTAKGPGISGCSYFNYINVNCKLPGVELSEIPDECTSLVVKRFYVDLNYHVAANPSNCEKNKINTDNLDKVLAFSKPVYVYYGYATQSEWTQVLACEVCDGGTNSLDEMKGLKAFFNEHPGITGVILSAFEHNEYSTEFPGFSENLKKYIEVMKSSFPGLEVGIQFEGQFLIDQYTNPQIPWLDIAVIEPVTDFFIISVMHLNDCTDESLYNSGIAPMTSSTTPYTMEKIKSILPELSIPKGKLYFKYMLNPYSDPNDSHTLCDLTIQQMCEHPLDTTLYCSESMESFYKKGQFAFENGAGFITEEIGLNDPENKCKCEKPFGSFYALLNGFECGIPKPCALYPCRQ
ncbi:hypothetical protein QTP88_000188 [Uroleucon formosanum]